MMKTKLFILFAIVCLGSAHAADNEAGRVVFSSGVNKAIDARGNSRVIRRGDIVRQGDRLQTSEGRMQVRFTDQGFVSIKPKSEMVISKYNYLDKIDGSERAFFSLLKGSIRAVTGLIGRKNKKNYQYQTPVATIGIRGTAFVLQLCDSDCFDVDGRAIPNGLYVNNGEGRLFVETQGGVIDLVRGQYAYVKSLRSPPRQILQPPAIRQLINNNRADVLDFVFRSVERDQRFNQSDNIRREAILSTITEGTNIAAAGTVAVGGETVLGIGATLVDGFRDVSVYMFDENNALTDFNQNYFFLDDTGARVITGSSSFDAGANAIAGDIGANTEHRVLWGRWDNDWQFNLTTQFLEGGNTQNFASSTPLRYQYIYSDNLTRYLPSGDPNEGGTLFSNITGSIKYDELVGGNSPIHSSGTLGTHTVALDIDFTNALVVEYSIAGEFGAAGSYSATLDDAQPLFQSLDLDASCSRICGDASTGTGISVIDFVGANAEALIGAYNLNFGGSTPSTISATFLLEQDDDDVFEPPVSNTPALGTEQALGYAYFDTANQGVAGSLFALAASPNNSVTRNVNEVTGFSDDQTGPIITFDAATANPGMVGQDVALGVSWGVWDNNFTLNDTQGGAPGTPVSAAVNDMHYLLFTDITPAASLPTTGSILYSNLIGGTGAQNSAGEFATGITVNIDIDFGSGSINDFSFGGGFASGDAFTASPLTLDFLNGAGTGHNISLIGNYTPSGAGSESLTGSAYFEFLGASAQALGSTFILDGAANDVVGSLVVGDSAAVPVN